MKKTIGVCGFLFHPPTGQILLSRRLQDWTLMEGQGEKIEDTLGFFWKIIYKSLKIKVDKKAIYPVYDYFDNRRKVTRFVYYAQVDKCFPVSDSKYSWVTFKAVNKLACSTQTRHDIVVAQRVISANARVNESLN